MEKELLLLLGDGSLDSGVSRVQANRRVEELVATLEANNPCMAPNAAPEALGGRWRLLTSFKPGSAAVSITSLKDWAAYLFDGGPSPVQSLVVGNRSTVSRIYQVLELAPTNRFLNIVDFSEAGGGCLVIAAEILELEGASNVRFRFATGFFVVTSVLGRLLDTPIKVPYPVPFRLLGERAYGGLDTTYLRGDVRIAVGSKGTAFVLRRETTPDAVDLTPFLATLRL